jgi:hypothetical protein
MSSKKWFTGIMGGLVLCALLSATVLAAEETPTPPAQRQSPPAGMDDRGPRGEGPRGFDMEGMQQRMMERMKEQMGATDDEWKVIEPRLSKVMSLNRQSAGRFMGAMGRRGGQGGPDRQRPESAQQQDNPVQKAQDTLQQTLENKDAPAATIKAQLTALREAREKAKQEMVVAQQQLREVLTLRQEAQLVMMGMLD